MEPQQHLLLLIRQRLPPGGTPGERRFSNALSAPRQWQNERKSRNDVPLAKRLATEFVHFDTESFPPLPSVRHPFSSHGYGPNCPAADKRRITAVRRIDKIPTRIEGFRLTSLKRCVLLTLFAVTRALAAEPAATIDTAIAKGDTAGAGKKIQGC